MSWVNSLIAWIKGFFTAFFELLKAMFLWVWETIGDLFRPLFEWIETSWNQFADYMSFPDASGLRDYFHTADMWVPLSEGMLLLGVYMTLYSTVIAVRFIIKVIPFLSN